MEPTYRFKILSPKAQILDEDVVSVVAPGEAGYLGVLAHHAPLITALQPGQLEIRDADQKETIFAVSGGFLEVSENRATILADAVEIPGEIDIERAERARERAKERLRDTSGSIDVPRAEVALKRALNRLRTARST